MKPLLTALALLILVTVPAYAETFPLIGKALVCVDEEKNPQNYPQVDDGGRLDLGSKRIGVFKFFEERFQHSPKLTNGAFYWEQIPYRDDAGESAHSLKYTTSDIYLEWSYRAVRFFGTSRLRADWIESYELSRMTLVMNFKTYYAWEPNEVYASYTMACRIATHEDVETELEKAYEEFLLRRKI